MISKVTIRQEEDTATRHLPRLRAGTYLMSLTAQAQRRRPASAPIATTTLWPASLQRMVSLRPHHSQTPSASGRNRRPNLVRRANGMLENNRDESAPLPNCGAPNQPTFVALRESPPSRR